MGLPSVLESQHKKSHQARCCEKHGDIRNASLVHLPRSCNMLLLKIFV